MDETTRDHRTALGSTLLAAGGVAAAFAAAACCGLPLALGTLGITGGAWLLDVAMLTGPWQRVLLWMAVALLVGALAVGLRRRATCSGGVCTSPVFRAGLVAVVFIGGGLVGISLAVG